MTTQATYECPECHGRQYTKVPLVSREGKGAVYCEDCEKVVVPVRHEPDAATLLLVGELEARVSKLEDEVANLRRLNVYGARR